MEIALDRSPFVQPVSELLRELNRIGFFTHGLLIGSWPMLVYTIHFTLPYGLTTDDIDFAVANAVKVPAKPTETIPQILERLGYTPIHDYSLGIETFLQGTFEVEFITHRRGGEGPPSVVIPPWQVSAQPLPFVDLLFIRPATVVVDNFNFRIPSPEALVLHKLIIAQRRTGRDREAKKEKDLQQCSVLVDVIRAEEVQRIVQEHRLSKEVRNTIDTSCTEKRIILPGW
ncbi:GSU2403 family nucleotidyltransferase fold protein [Geotalea sp. SG265]|uniref:GSU2403 family nucleotidyltransferase fold protein n=1 Tax=Geotalea sp. SG265 TaxID=2922867 RepID=UPI001FAFF925